MTQSPVIGFFVDRQSSEQAADALRSSGFDDIKFSTSEDFNPGLVPANPKRNRWHMEKAYFGIAIGIVVGAILGGLMGLALGKLWAAVGAVALACAGGAMGLLIADRHTHVYEEMLSQGGVLLILNFENMDRTPEAIAIMRRSGARKVSANRPGDSPHEGS